MRLNYLTGKELRVDARGRVRFAYKGHRFEVTNKGVNVYNRGHWLFPAGAEYAMIAVNVSMLSNPQLLRTLVNAVEMVAETKKEEVACAS